MKYIRGHYFFNVGILFINRKTVIEQELFILFHGRKKYKLLITQYN